MADTIIHVGDVGTVFRLTITENDEVTVVDVSGATVKRLIFRSRSGVSRSRNASFTTDGTDGKIEYRTAAGDIDEAGRWWVQGYVELATGGKYYSVAKSFTVRENLL